LGAAKGAAEQNVFVVFFCYFSLLSVRIFLLPIIMISVRTGRITKERHKNKKSGRETERTDTQYSIIVTPLLAREG
jgi:hypothetical protein